MMAKFQRFGGAMFTPVVFFVFSGIIVGLTSVFTNPTIMGSLAADGTVWSSIWKVIDAGGWTVFNNMEVLFVIGLPLGLANKAKERAALEAFVLYMTFNNFVSIILQMFGKNFGVNFNSTSQTSGLKVIAGVKTLDTGVIGAILIAALVVWLHKRYFDVKLPDWLGVFQGSAFVAIIGFFAMIPLAGLFTWIWPAFQHGVLQLQYFMTKSGALGVFSYIFLEKALLPVGLHHFIYAPFQYGPAVVEGGTTLYWMKHISAFAASTKPLIELYPQGGFAMQGMSNIFGIPGIACAFYVTAKSKNRRKLLALIVPGVLTAVFAGITEPFDYTFLFIAPALFFVHAFLAACLATTMWLSGVTGDMGGGLIEIIAKNYVPMWANHWMTYVIQWGIGLAFIVIYFLIFRYLIIKFDFKTPGRSDDEMINMFSKDDYKNKGAKSSTSHQQTGDSPFRVAARGFLQLLGGPGNIQSVNNCFTRLRLTINDISKLGTDAQFTSFGAKGVVRNGDAVQVIIGPDVTNIREEVEALMGEPDKQNVREAELSHGTAVASVMETQLYAPVDGELTDLTVVHDDVFSKKMIGNGFAVKPSSNEIFAGVNGEISSIFPTKHAIGIMSESHAEILLHLGIDTVELKGEPFEITAHVGDVVTPETLVAKMNIEGVTASGKDPTVLMVVTNSSQFEDEDDPIKKRSVQHGDKVFTLKPK